MMLYREQDLSRVTVLRDEKGKEMSAMIVFSASIKYLKDHLIATFESKDTNIKREDIHWVITVPAIWSDSAKRFMREAAINAEIHTDKVSLSLEPEAASLYCQYLPVQRVLGKDRPEVLFFQKGDRYMVLDAGGGTVDITVHEVLEDKTLKEFAKANGGDWGGARIDEKFEELITDILGPDVYEVCKNRLVEDYLDLMQNFEIKKRTIKPETSGLVRFQIPASFVEMFKDLNNGSDDVTTKLPDRLKGKVILQTDKLSIDADVVKGLYKEVCGQICKTARDFFDSMSQYKVDTILMVGGFSESEMLQDHVRKTFPRHRIIVPEDAGFAVLKGAVLFGHNPTMIAARVCRYSYGIRAFKHFEPGIDPVGKRVVQHFEEDPSDKSILSGDVVLCKDYFSKHATIGEEISTDDQRYTQEYRPSEASGPDMQVHIYSSPRRFPMYTDDIDCRKIGEARIPIGECKSFKIAFQFGATELGVKAVDAQSGTAVKNATFDMLSSMKE